MGSRRGARAVRGRGTLGGSAVTAIVAVVALLQALVGVGMGGGSPAGAATSQSGSLMNSRISGLLAVGTGVRLVKKDFHLDQGSGVCDFAGASPIPETVQGSSAAFCYEARRNSQTDNNGPVNTEVHFSYQIESLQGGAYKDSGYYLTASAKVPYTGKNEISCQIKPNGSADGTDSSPYVCATSFAADTFGNEDPQPHWSVTSKPVNVIDAKTATADQLNAARDLIVAVCGAGQPECTYESTSQRIYAPPQSQWVPLGNGDVNCDSHPDKTYEYDQGYTWSWSNSLGGKVQGKFQGLDKIFTLTVEVTYQHSWTASQSYSEKHVQKVPYGKVGFFYLQPGLLEIVGTFQISSRDSVQVIKNFTVNLPLASDYDPGHGFPPIHIGLVWPVQKPVDCPSATTSTPTVGVPSGATVVGKAQRAG